MKKLLAFIAFLLPFAVFAQTYPSPTFNSVTLQNPLTPSNGGTGVANSATLTLGGPLVTSGSSSLTLATTGATSLTLPTSGTLLTTAGASSTYAPIASPTFTGTVTVPAGTINNASIGATTASTGSFTTLAASSAVSGSGFTSYLASPPSIGGTTPAAGAFTNLSASGTVSGAGFSNYLASPPAIGGTSSASGSFTALSATGNFTPSQTNGIVGTTTNNNANAGSVGEYVTATQSTGISLTNNTIANITSISLTAGDWDVTGSVNIVGSSNVTAAIEGTSSTSATQGSLGTYCQYVGTAVTQVNQSVPVWRYSLSATTTIYLIGEAAFSTGSVTGDGVIRARRVR